ncbi:MAG: polymer-forming cytoskeletal protein [Betaproteobacteria bacterium]|nr:polymer-forming cytoskeletal protein [Betaproteobacteria bacterium]
MSDAKSLVPFAKQRANAHGKTATQEGITSLLAKSARLEGNLILQEGVKIDGHFIGNLSIPEEHEHLFMLAEGGLVEGTVTVGRAHVAGRINGKLTAGSLVLASTARVDGEIAYKSIRIAEGATINGKIFKRSDAEFAMPNTETADGVVQIGKTALKA